MGLWDKIKDIVFISDEDEFDEEAVEETEQSTREKFDDESYYAPKKEVHAKLIKSKSTNYATTPSGMQLILERPTRFDEVTGIADQLNVGKAIVLNLEETPKDVQRRIVDFLSGAAYAHGGDMKKVSKYIFIVAARGVDISGEIFSDGFEDDKVYF